MPCQIFYYSYLAFIKIRFRRKLFDFGCLRRTDFHIQFASGAQMRRRFTQNAPIESEPVRSTIEGELRFVLADLRLKGGDFRTRNVWRVGRDDVKFFGAKSPFEGCQEVTLLERNLFEGRGQRDGRASCRERV